MRTSMFVLLLAGALAMSACDNKKPTESKPTAETPKAAADTKKAPDTGAAKKAAPKNEPTKKVAETVTAAVGKAAPAFTLKDQDGKEHKLSDYKGKIVVLEWTCPTCPYVERHYEAKTMSKTHEAVGKDVVWLAIDSSKFVTPEKSKEWKETEKFSYPVLQDPSGGIGKAYAAKTTPHMYVIDKEGVLQYQGAIDDNPRAKGETKTNYVLNAVKALQEGKPVANSETKPYGCSVKYGS